MEERKRRFDDDDMLARHAKVSPAKWAKMKKVVMAFWTLDGRSKRWVQKRLKKERRSAVDRSQKAKGAAASRWNDKEKGDAKAMLTQCHPFIPSSKRNFSRRASERKKSDLDLIAERFDHG
jgi:uncharacterized protein YdaU (DUF1376 family)